MSGTSRFISAPDKNIFRQSFSSRPNVIIVNLSFSIINPGGIEAFQVGQVWNKKTYYQNYALEQWPHLESLRILSMNIFSIWAEDKNSFMKHQKIAPKPHKMHSTHNFNQYFHQLHDVRLDNDILHICSKFSQLLKIQFYNVNS